MICNPREEQCCTREFLTCTKRIGHNHEDRKKIKKPMLQGIPSLNTLRLLRLLSLAPLVRCAAAVGNLRRGPRLPQAVHARMVASVAVVDAGVRCRRQPGWWRRREARGRRQLVGAAPVRRLAAV